jgi:hypothetical protein
LAAYSLQYTSPPVVGPHGNKALKSRTYAVKKVKATDQIIGRFVKITQKSLFRRLVLQSSKSLKGRWLRGLNPGQNESKLTTKILRRLALEVIVVA